jgi:hypothetical protein
MVTLQLPVPLHAPDQPVNIEPEAGVAVKVTLLLVVNWLMQVAPQLMPAGVLVIVPVPTFITVKVCVRIEK